ncbi:hypothetical protein ACLKA6_018643 [Drosophila palustris]
MFWSDSMITLGWIRSGSARLKTFVANRINKILELTEDRQWRHIASEDNPADLLSRGMSATKLADCALWWHGPPWLKSAQTEWPRINPNQDSTQIGIDDEMRHLHCRVLLVSEDARCWILERYSSYTRLVRVLTYVNRFIHNCRIKKPDRLVDLISYAELSKGIIYASVWSLGAVLEIHRNLQEIDVGVNSMMHPGLTSSKGGECSGYAKQFNPSSATKEQL